MRNAQTMTRMIFVISLVCLTLALSASAQVFLTPQKTPRRDGQMPRERMEVVARRLNLGAKRADSERPRTTQSGHGDRASGYYQCFERGCVYYGAGTGVHAVNSISARPATAPSAPCS